MEDDLELDANVTVTARNPETGEEEVIVDTEAGVGIENIEATEEEPDI